MEWYAKLENETMSVGHMPSMVGEACPQGGRPPYTEVHTERSDKQSQFAQAKVGLEARRRMAKERLGASPARQG